MKIKIKGGNPLIGEMTPAPNKNAILTTLPVALLTSEDCHYTNVPKTTDVEIILQIIKLLGGSAEWTSADSLTINCKNLNSSNIDPVLGGRLRSSILFVGPLLARFGEATVPIPGGCVLGKRSIAGHIDIFNQVGVKSILDSENSTIKFIAPEVIEPEYKIWPIEQAVTPCENLIMYASGINSTIYFTGANSEPHVMQLTQMLESMGANIQGIKSDYLTIKGNDKLVGSEINIWPDQIDIAGIIVAAAITKGNIRLKSANIYEVVEGMLSVFEKFNVNIQRVGTDLIINQKEDLKLDWQNSGFPLANDGVVKLNPRPWPGFPVDAIPMMVPLACKTQGAVLINNWMYESGLEFVSELNLMGGNIFRIDGSKIIINGPVKFHSADVELDPPAIIQATLAVVLTCFCDNCENVVQDITPLYRRYPDFVGTYKNLGAEIEVLD